MTFIDLLRKCCFHDSYLEKIEFDSDRKTLAITIHFCNWMQSYYQPDMEELTIIQLVFNNVKSFECDSPEKKDWNYSISDSSPLLNPVYGNGIEFLLIDDNTGIPEWIRIYAQDVEFIELGPDRD